MTLSISAWLKITAVLEFTARRTTVLNVRDLVGERIFYEWLGPPVIYEGP
jgi:hypothetical protein